MRLVRLIKELYQRPVITLNRGLGWVKFETLRKQHICIACFPKSGSTFLARVLEKALCFKFIHYAYMGDSEHNISESRLIDNLHYNTVTHLHMTATSNNRLMISRYNLKLVVQVRNIFDCLISLRDHIRDQAKVWPMAVVEEEFLSWDERKQFDFLIDNFVPWYIKFYVSWYTVSQSQPVYWLRYEDLMENKYATISNLLIYHKVKFESQKLKAILDSNAKLKKGDFRYNVGISGRGREKLNNTQIERIVKFTKYYPSINFQRIGID